MYERIRFLQKGVPDGSLLNKIKKCTELPGVRESAQTRHNHEPEPTVQHHHIDRFVTTKRNSHQFAQKHRSARQYIESQNKRSWIALVVWRCVIIGDDASQASLSELLFSGAKSVITRCLLLRLKRRRLYYVSLCKRQHKQLCCVAQDRFSRFVSIQLSWWMR